ncbi:phosphate regulon sensor histidine kinase PhoR [Allohahella marinimesophila]|uniref:Phosphate regulon sensor protein PhoR n=1 Tax=Allohahella marinimesophila TaxID=1054972 RepID=A0ABP7PUY5_9GAMM
MKISELIVQPLVIFFLVILPLGLLIGQPLALTFAAIVLYLLWSLRQVYRLASWLQQPGESEPPESHGLWGRIFDSILRLQAEHSKAQARLQALLNRIQQSTNALKDGVILTNSDGVMDWWNSAAADMLGLRKPNDTGQTIHYLVRDPSFKQYFFSKAYDDPLLLSAPKKPQMQLKVHITLFGEDDRLIVIQDVTQLKQLESVRQVFISNVSHELRTPLTVISGYLETLIDTGADLAPRRQRALSQMQTQARRMEALVTDLLLLSKIENEGGEIRQLPVNMHDLLLRILDSAKVVAGDKVLKISLAVESDARLYGNETQLHSAFSNLVLNAVKYTPEGKCIDIRWHLTKRHAVLSVTDTGIGIDSIHIPRLTERFYRADPSRHTGTGGTGLGLAIVKHVLLNHDARLDISSRPGEGSCFACLFPIERIREPEVALEVH